MLTEQHKAHNGTTHATATQPSNATSSLKILAARVLARRRASLLNGDDEKKLPSQLYATPAITKRQLREFLGEDWDNYKDNMEALIAWADLLMTSQLIEQGKAPPHYTSVIHCIHCGDVPAPSLAINSGQVLGCMWCWNRMKNLPIPKVTNLNK